MVTKKEVEVKLKEIEEKSKEEYREEKQGKNKKDIKAFYNICIDLLKYYIDMEERYYPMIALWIVGTYFHKSFPTYPFLYINAVKGSGKTRLLKLISVLSCNGRMQMDLTDATLFRLAENSTFCIDELENINRKEKSTLRLLLNAAYKKGISVPRMVKILGKQELEEFPVYCPIAMANIYGIDDVLQDRCLTIQLDKSRDHHYTKILEAFSSANRISGVVMQEIVLFSKYGIMAYNDYIKPNTTHTTYTQHTTTTTQHYITLHPFFKKIKNSNIEGRHLELFFPLLFMAWQIDKDIFELNLSLFEEMAKKKISDEVFENRDISLLDYLYQLDIKPINEYLPVMELTKKFKEWLHEGEEKEVRWLNTRWYGLALKRLNIIRDKKRVRKGVEVMIDFDKVKNKLAKFKDLSEPAEDKPQEEEKIVTDEEQTTISQKSP